MTIVGRTYLERGEPVEVLCQWRSKNSAIEDGTFGIYACSWKRTSDSQGWAIPFQWRLVLNSTAKSGPRNVLIRRANGDLVVRPFRGLRKP